MSSKQKKTKKQKRIPVRIISPQTVTMPAESTVTAQEKPVVAVASAAEKHLPASDKPFLLSQELKRIALVTGVILIILIISSIVF